MKKTNKLLIIILGFIVVLIITLIIIQHKRDSRPFNHFDFPTTLTVSNETNYKELDTITLVLANKIFNIDTVNIIIHSMPKHLMNGDIEYFGITQDYRFNNTYLILIKRNMSLEKLKLIMSHEFVHIEQYENGMILTKQGVIFKGKKICFSTVPYEKRPYEIEAFERQNDIKKQLNNLLYK